MALSMWGQVVIQATMPQEDPVKVGTIWIDTSSTPAPKVCTAVAPYTFADISSGAATWGSITGTLSDQTDLQTELDGKADSSHVHSAADLTSGTVPDARFPATLPAASGVNLTALNATNLGSGTVPDARFPATLPAASGANLTALNASNLGSGTVPLARLSGITNTEIAAAAAIAASKLKGSIQQIAATAIGGDFTTSSGTLVDLTNATITLTTLANSTVLLLFTCPASITGGALGLWDWNKDGADDGAIQGVVQGTNETHTVTLFKRYTGLSAASHTFKLRVRTSNGADTLSCSMGSVMNGTLIAIEVSQ